VIDRCPRALRRTAHLAALAALIGAAPAPLRAQAAQGPPEPVWRWPEEQVLKAVNAVRAGRSLQPRAWPDGARVAVLLSFDVDNETVFLAPDGTNIGGMSQGQYGSRVGLRRVLAALDRHRIPASFFAPAMSYRIAPEQVALIKAAGRHEFALHGWIHELNSTLPAEAERELLQRAVRHYEQATGARPVGYRAPSWNFSPATLAILRELGMLYDSSLMADDSPYELLADGAPTGIVEIPVEWINDDAPLLNPRGDRYGAPEQLLQVWKDEFDRAYEERTMFVLTMHPHIIGHRSRIVLLERLIDHMRAKPGVWVATHRAAAEYAKANAGAGTR
jgi:peptidoglycan-N-acetylglucosamine deacetylase